MDVGLSVPASQAEKVAAKRYESALGPSPEGQSSRSQSRAHEPVDAPSSSSATGPFSAVKESRSTLDVSTFGEGSRGALDGGNFTSHTERKPPFEGRKAASEYSTAEWGLLDASTVSRSDDSVRSDSTVHAETEDEWGGEINAIDFEPTGLSSIPREPEKLAFHDKQALAEELATSGRQATTIAWCTHYGGQGRQQVWGRARALDR